MRRSWTVAVLVGVAAVAAATLIRPAPVSCEGDAAKPTYAGPDSCKKCHLKQAKSWKTTPLAKAFDVLKPGEAADKKKAAGLDPAADYCKDAKCLKCHTTAYGKDGGYPAVVEGKAFTEEETARAALTAGVTCEACHGPGSLYGPFKKTNEKFKLEEIQKLGATAPMKAEHCAECHAKECPTMPADYAFDFEKMKKSPNMHEHVPLKFPH